MKRVRLIAVTFLCATLLCVSLPAQTPVIAPPLPIELRATDEQIATLLDVMRVKDQLADILNLMPMIMQQQMSTLPEKFSGLQLTPEQKEIVENFMQRNIERSLNLYPINAVIADAGTVYQKYVHREDIDALIAFYRTPAGQRMLDAQPIMATELATLIMSRAEKFSRTFGEELVRETQELIKELSESR